MTESYILHYFPFAGRAEPIRMLLKYGGIPFVDNRIPFERWPEVKQSMPWKQLPVLEIKGKLMISQSIAICRYLAKKVQLVGHDARENLRIDVTIDTLTDLTNGLVDYAIEEEEEKKAILHEKLLNKTIPTFLERFEERAKHNRGYIALTRLTWAEIICICTYEDAVNFVKKDILADYPNLVEVRRNVLNVPAIKEWIQTRPENPLNTYYDLKEEL